MKYPNLFKPIQIAGTVFRNRIFASPEGFYNVGEDRLPNLQEAAFFERKASGGAASVCVGDCVVDSGTGTHYPFLIRMDDPNTLPGLSGVARAISRHGAVASAELSHAGMFAGFVKSQGGTLYGPVDMPDGKYGEVKEMPEEIIEHIIDSFGKAAAWAKQCGFGMVTIHAGHGWLIPQFMSSRVNTRKDRWGGSFENRMRLPLAIVESIRKYAGRRFPIEIRISGSECDPSCYDIEEGLEIAKALDEKVDILHISAGHHEIGNSAIITHPTMFLPEGVNVKYAAEIKKHVKTPVATVGGLTDPAMMEEIIASGQADIIELGRQTLADPDFPIKARTGREDEINKCMRCCTCFVGCAKNRTPQCSINPIIGQELEEKFTAVPKEKKKVLVIGGGVGGMQTALTASKQGHEVILCEKSDRLGGTLLCEEKVPFKKRLDDYLKRQALLISRAPIELRLNTEVTPELAKEIGADVIVAALGARPAVPPIPGIDGENVMGAEELYNNPEKAGKNIAILGGGLVGLELGIFMAGKGHKVTIVEMLDKLTVEMGMHTMALMSEVDKLGVDVHLSTKVLKITDKGVSCEGPSGHLELEADTVVYATGQVPLIAEAFALSDCASEFYQIGDCAAPRNILAATQEAYTIARNIGRQ